VPVDGRFEHIVFSCNATSDHSIIWIEREAQRAMDVSFQFLGIKLILFWFMPSFQGNSCCCCCFILLACWLLRGSICWSESGKLLLVRNKMPKSWTI
jgi:hypothetical protein